MNFPQSTKRRPLQPIRAFWDRASSTDFLRYKDRAGLATVVDFDVAITSEETEKSEIGGGVRVLSVFREDGGLEANTLNGSVSRVRFKIPLQLPGGRPHERRQPKRVDSEYDPF